MNTHLVPEQLADLREGLLEPQQEAAAAAHLATCARCRADHEALGRSAAVLSAAAEAGPMPGELVDRLDEALSAAATAPTARSGAAAVTVTPLDEARRRTPFGTRFLQAAAVIVILLAAGAIGISAFQGGSSGGGDNTAASDQVEARGPDNGLAGGYPVIASGTDYTEKTVGAAVQKLLAAPAAARDGKAAANEYAGGSGVRRLSGGAPLADCVTALADGPATPVGVDLAEFDGTPAAVIVLPAPDEPQSLDVWVVGPGCSQADAKLLHFARVPRR